MIHVFNSPFFPLLFLLGASFLTSLATVLLLLGKYKSQAFLHNKSRSFFFLPVFRRFFTKNEWENLYLTIGFTKHILRLFYAASAYLFALPLYQKTAAFFLALALIITALSIGVDFLFRLSATMWTTKMLHLFFPVTSLFLLIFFPITCPLLKIFRFFYPFMGLEHKASDLHIKDKIKEFIRESDLKLDTSEQKLIASFITFRERVAKEIMVPRIDMTALSSEMPIEEAAKLFIHERYSRIPVYKDSLDEIIGVLLYKDLLQFYMEKKSLEAPIETLVKPVIYSPENKKISALLQEFKTKQLHLAIVVDEYGGTEGIVTIEDILEELVGEIEDEYDDDEEDEYWSLPNGSWIVDAKMSILDIENKLNIHIPHHPEYETIGGYIFHRAGTIPSKGWSMHHDAFDLEVLSSSERSIEKIRITPRSENDS